MIAKLRQWVGWFAAPREVYVVTADGRAVVAHTTFQGAAEEEVGDLVVWEVVNVDLVVD